MLNHFTLTFDDGDNFTSLDSAGYGRNSPFVAVTRGQTIVTIDEVDAKAIREAITARLGDAKEYRDELTDAIGDAS